jgi:hypothetical protein
MRKILQFLAKRSVFFITALLIGLGILLVWFLITGFSTDSQRITIGIAVIAAFLAAISAIANLLQAVEVQKQRQSQERPYLTAFFDGESNGFVVFVIQNAGNSPALNVKFQFVPAPIDFKGRTLDMVSLFANPITFLPPGKTMRQIIDVGHKFLAEGKPTKFTLTVTYTSIWHEIYAETVTHDLEYLKQATVPSKTIEDYLKTISEQMSSFVQLFRNSQGMSSLLVETPDQYQARLERIKNDRRDLPRWKYLLQSWLQWLLSKVQ